MRKSQQEVCNPPYKIMTYVGDKYTGKWLDQAENLILLLFFLPCTQTRHASFYINTMSFQKPYVISCSSLDRLAKMTLPLSGGGHKLDESKGKQARCWYIHCLLKMGFLILLFFGYPDRLYTLFPQRLKDLFTYWGWTEHCKNHCRSERRQPFSNSII